MTGQFILMWERAVNSMVAAALSSTAADDTSAPTTEDVNVENLQLLLMLFHSLQVCVLAVS